ncbi:hypothetical protein [Streptomyces sp. NPDC057579]|uniref:hypothetical protein n=1 Tax=Streptomyces sp. NPDC057579 TaxID=3346172 RepID=UPI0036C86A4C
MRPSNTNVDALGERDYPIEEQDLTDEQNEHRTETLRAVRDNPNAPEPLRQLAKKMLSGRLQLKDVLDDAAGHRALTEGLAPLREQWRTMSPQQRQATRQYDPDEHPDRGGDAGRSPRY